MPALQALKDTFPGVEIVLLGKPWHQEYLKNRPSNVDRVVVVPPYPGVGAAYDYVVDEAELDRFFAEMQAENFDLAFQFHGGGKNSNPFMLRLGAKKVIGLKSPVAPEVDVSVPYVLYFGEPMRYLEMVALAGAKTLNIEPCWESIPQDLAELIEILPDCKNQNLIVLHPGATDMRRRWPAKKFAAVADELINAGFTIAITGTDFEKQVVNEVWENIRQKQQALNLCSQLSLAGMTGLLAVSKLVIANDTGPIHLARALKTPTVGIFWCSNAITGMPFSVMKNRTLISFMVDCPLCGQRIISPTQIFPPKGDCTHQTCFVDEITEKQVLDSAQNLLIQTKNWPQNVPVKEIGFINFL
ncbi:MAG: glycosyltransferase family 9 protein [Sphingobacteriaceae bacterium]|nr:MAG: glycosyltransferase family 9 protein [Sphingobacteriaceae bacterium]